MENHKDLPPGAQAWAREVDKARDTIKHLEAVVQRVCSSTGLDYRNPTRGINQGDTPGVQNGLPLKLNSLNDMDVRNAQDGDFVMWSSTKNRWVPGQAPSGGQFVTPADTWSSTVANTNLITNPSFEAGVAGWQTTSTFFGRTAFTTNIIENVQWIDGGFAGTKCLSATVRGGSGDPSSANKGLYFGGIPVVSGGYIPGIAAWFDLAFGGTFTWQLLDGAGNELAKVFNDMPPAYGWYANQWQVFKPGSINPDDYPGAATWALYVELAGFPTNNATAEVRLDCFTLSLNDPTTDIRFDGNGTFDDQNIFPQNYFTYEWDGTPNASASNLITPRLLHVPANITLGTPFAFDGTGFAAGAVVSIRCAESYSVPTVSSVKADASGAFSGVATIYETVTPGDAGQVKGPGRLYAVIDSGSQFARSVPLDVTFK